jgi:hypothetical protein
MGTANDTTRRSRAVAGQWMPAWRPANYRRIKAFQRQISLAERFVGIDLPLPMHVWYTH